MPLQGRARPREDTEGGCRVTVIDHGEAMGREIAMQTFDTPFSTGEEIAE